MSFRDRFFSYGKKIGDKHIPMEYSQCKRIPFVIMGLIPHTHIRQDEEFYKALTEEQKARYTLLLDYVMHHYSTHFLASKKSLKSIRRKITKKMQRIENER